MTLAGRTRQVRRQDRPSRAKPPDHLARQAVREAEIVSHGAGAAPDRESAIDGTFPRISQKPATDSSAALRRGLKNAVRLEDRRNTVD
jgi:hypothetical protein